MAVQVLLVDDEPDARKTYHDILSSAGYDVRDASSGEEALEALGGFRPDVILLDIRLPGMSGIELARRVSPDIPIVMITALNTLPTVAGIGAIRRFVYKPCRPKTLIEGVEDALRYPY